MANVVVCARFRPPSRSERASGSAIVGGAIDSKTAQFKLAGGPSPPFVFDHVFDVGSTQEEVFQHSARHLVTEVFGGYNATIFAYGQTGSGKTHTMMGEVKTPQRGIIPRLVEAIFSGIEEAPPDIEFTVKLSYVEIYNEKIRDLLNPSSDDLKIREMTGKGVWIEGVTESYVGANEQVLEIMNQGATNRAIASTNMNLESSRSHSVFILTLGQRDTKTEGKKASKLILVDLAGSEKISKTGAEGKTLKEAQHINKSLAALGNVINALTTAGKKHVPYRDSKLTRLLSDSLGGNSKTTLLVTCSPCADNVEESLTTLRFGQRAKTIKNKPIVNAEKSVAEYVKLLAIAQTKINAQSQIIRLLEKDVLDLRNCVAGVDPKHLKTPMPAIRRHTLEEIMAGVKHEEEEKKEDEEGQDDDSEAADSKDSSRSTSPTPLTAAAPAVTAPAAAAAAAPAPAADKPARRIIKITPVVTSPTGAATPTTPSASPPSVTSPGLPRGMSIFMGPGVAGGPGLLGPHDSVIAESAALQERMEELKKERLEVADQLADKVRELEEQRQDVVRVNEQLKELTARKEEAEVRAQGSDQLRTELNLLRAKLGTLEREQTLAANDWARQLQEAKQQLTAAKIAAAAIQAQPVTAASALAAGGAGDAATATPGPAPTKAPPTGNITPDVVIEALRMSLKKKCDQFAELSQVQDSRRDQIVMLERALDEVKLKARAQDTEVKTLRDELTSAKHMCKRLLESGLYWRQLRKTEMGQTGVVTLQGGGGAVVTMRGGSGARALPGGATLHPMPGAPGASGGGAAGGPPPASPASIARADPRMVTSPTSSGVSGGVSGVGGASVPYTPPPARGSLSAGSTPLRVHPNPNILLSSPQPSSSSASVGAAGAASFSPAAAPPTASR